ncbi:hypothetical protein MMC21_000317 [Puttea exsequens]|nr:hypothetical protein [Puttea exsequens]
MAPPKEEWQIWAYDCKLKIDSLQQQLNKHVQPHADLQHLEAEIKTLTASRSEDQLANDIFQRRVQALETETNAQNQINEVNAQNEVERKREFAQQEREFASVLRALGKMQETNLKEREQFKIEMRLLREQVEALARGDGVRVQEQARAASQATTVDDSMQLDHEHDSEYRPQPTGSSSHGFSFQPQGSIPMAQYLANAEEIIQQFEQHAINTFLNGIRINHQRSILKGELKTMGWSWPNLRQSVNAMVAAMKRRKENMRSLPSLVA